MKHSANRDVEAINTIPALIRDPQMRSAGVGFRLRDAEGSSSAG
jgi:hypothetical protein